MDRRISARDLLSVRADRRADRFGAGGELEVLMPGWRHELVKMLLARLLC